MQAHKVLRRRLPQQALFNRPAPRCCSSICLQTRGQPHGCLPPSPQRYFWRPAKPRQAAPRTRSAPQPPQSPATWPILPKRRQRRRRKVPPGRPPSLHVPVPCSGWRWARTTAGATLRDRLCRRTFVIGDCRQPHPPRCLAAQPTRPPAFYWSRPTCGGCFSSEAWPSTRRC